jgi:hypothetical protein
MRPIFGKKNEKEEGILIIDIVDIQQKVWYGEGLFRKIFHHLRLPKRSTRLSTMWLQRSPRNTPRQLDKDEEYTHLHETGQNSVYTELKELRIEGLERLLSHSRT